MLSDTDVEPKAINGMGLDGRKSLGRAMLRAPLVNNNVNDKFCQSSYNLTLRINILLDD